MKIVIGSTSAPKVSATKEVFADFFKGEDIAIVSIEVDSGVSPTPFSVEECILGGRTRIEKCRQSIPDADYYVGIESGVLQTDEFTFLTPWAVIFKRATNKESVGSGALVPVKAAFFSKFDSSVEISDTMRYELFDPKLVLQKKTLGVGGVLTQGVIQRHDQVCLALKVALSTVELLQ
jgi:non-canonical (house-cleaning) NTP pyrophosphatase